MIFMFYKDDIATYFEQLLVKEDIDYKREDEKDRERPRTLFAIKRVHLDKAIQLNYTAHGKYRRPSLDHNGLRWGLIIFVMLLLGISLYAYITHGVKH